MFPLSHSCCPQPACEDPHHAKPEVRHFLNQRQKAIFIDRKYCKVSSCDGIGGSRTLVDDGHFAKNVAAGQPLQQLCASPDLDRAGLDDVEDTALLAAVKNDLSSFEPKVLPAVAGKDTEIEVGMCHAQLYVQQRLACSVGRQAYRGNSQKPRSLDSRVAGNQDSEVYRQGLLRKDLRVTGP